MENKKTFRELLTIGEVITTQAEDGVVVHIADTVVYDITVDGDETAPILDMVIPMGGADHEE